MKLRRYIIVALVISLFVSVAGAEALSDGFGSQGAVRVTADHMEAETLDHKVVFSGNVRASQNDVVIYAQSLTLYYIQGESDRENGIERAEIEGDVRIVQQERMATAERGLFLNQERKIVLSGQAEVHQGGNVVKGDEIIYLLDEDRSIVKSSPDTRVNAVIKPKEATP